MSKLTDKVVIVTGGSSGIGRAAARRFAEAGAKVVITGRCAAALDEAAGDHRNISAVVADAASPEDAVPTVATTVDAHAPLVDSGPIGGCLGRARTHHCGLSCMHPRHTARRCEDNQRAFSLPAFGTSARPYRGDSV